LDGGGQSVLSGHVAIDANGNVYLEGDFYNTVTLGTTVLTSPSREAYVAKYDAQGALQWVRQGGGGEASTSGIAVDASGNVALTGYSGAAVFGGPALAGAGIYYTKLSPAGTVLQATRVSTGGTFSTEGGLALDAVGNAYLVGTFSGSPTFGTTVLPNSAGYYNLFLCKLDAAGVPLWARSISGPNGANAGGVAVDAAGNALVCGSSGYGLPYNGGPGILGSMLYVARFGPQGAPLWTQAIGPLYLGPVANSLASGVAYDGRGGCFVTGQLAGTATFGPTTLTTSNAQTFVVRYNGTGTPVWADRSIASGASTNSSGGTGIAAGPGGSIYLVGTVVGPAAFGPLATTPPTSGRADLYVAKLAAGGVLAARASTAAARLAAYPNPATDFVTLTLPAGGGHLALVDALGRVVRTQALPVAAGPGTVSLAGLAPGLYQMQATLASGAVARTTLQVR
ncbi:MAG: hypothetical protein JWR44_1399, partial [Hymenobacter sp.]|nr:hypothetical protein [Hymenobacter sp.]